MTTTMHQFIRAIGLTLLLASAPAMALKKGNECTATKAATNAAMKATVGVKTSRCTPAKAATNAVEDTVGVDQKGSKKVAKNGKRDDRTGKKKDKDCNCDCTAQVEAALKERGISTANPAAAGAAVNP